MLCASECLQSFGFVCDQEFCDSKDEELDCFCCACGKSSVQTLKTVKRCECNKKFGEDELIELVEEEDCRLLKLEDDNIFFLCSCGKRARSTVLEFLSGRRCKPCNISKSKDALPKKLLKDKELVRVLNNSKLWFGLEKPKRIKRPGSKGIKYQFCGMTLFWHPDILDEENKVCIETKSEECFQMEKERTLAKILSATRQGYKAKLIVYTKEGEEDYTLHFPRLS
ncbi:hypothetical protein ISTM_92 [Insectomime virus]|uniref:Uncharacterized protein n=1 Tax=Tunisvirus fontaine2 TaxID=1421067 RepID=V9SGD4_9VIRU|nr:hypothetical protein D1R32_gp232 [Tunisvirus fontaine2]AHA45990.1 hypothetical protein ISTM_92 [Insectomime virus]AHC54949.1 hypothetical protein TNS_ORF231 [Tunisvirus fontaine2]